MMNIGSIASRPGHNSGRTIRRRLLGSTDPKCVAAILCATLSVPAHAATCATDTQDVVRVDCAGDAGATGENGKNFNFEGTSENNGKTGHDGESLGEEDWVWNYAVMPGRATGPTIAWTWQGGRGGDGGQAGQTNFTGSADGGDGGTGGSAGFVNGLYSYNTISVPDGNTSPPVVFALQGGRGGDGGGSSTYGHGGGGGTGGSGGRIAFVQDGGTITSTVGGVAAVFATATGGNGGNAQSSESFSADITSRAGGAGGVGGTIEITAGGSISSAGDGIVAISMGGNGGNGGGSGTTFGTVHGGAGGVGGGGGSLTVNLTGEINATGAAGEATGAQIAISNNVVLTPSVLTAGIRATSTSGLGGAGGSSSGGFGSGTGGGGGTVSADATVTVSIDGGRIGTAGYLAQGVVAQSIGGHGGNGAYSGGVFVSHGGSGAVGGDGGRVNYLGQNGGSIHTQGADSAGILLQSIGGGGGAGGDAHSTGVLAGVALGGIGGNGGNGGSVLLSNGFFDVNADFTQVYGFTPGQTVATSGARSAGMIAQSIGGGGGTGGDADEVTAGFVAVAIGGHESNGGDGHDVSVFNGGVVQTTGGHAAGMIAQSVGGGGGTGGSANAIDYNLSVFASSIALGGTGDSTSGVGGHGGKVIADNHSQILTQGGGSIGMIAQSIGGGGGIGGSSLGVALTAINFEDVPTIKVDYSMGGKGGNGGDGGEVLASNYGAILTMGNAGRGMVAQSIGGGGGSGGSSDAFSASLETSTFSATIAIGGKGGNGGAGGKVTANNGGLIATFAEDSTALLAQSVGGGGGIGGYGSATDTSVQGEGVSIVVDVAVGGAGGKGGSGGEVNVTNSSSGILTLGDNSGGVVAESVGGGGGWAGAGNAANTNGQFNVHLAVGGGGGAAGDGGAVTVNNDGAILTLGAGSAGIYAHSIGGGGGKGGNAAAKGAKNPTLILAEYMAQGFGGNDENIEQIDGLWELKENGEGVWEDLSKLKKVYQAYNGTNAGEVPAEGEQEESLANEVNLNVGGGVAGNGGSAGSGGVVNVTNSSAIETDGAGSSAIFAQSVGGGGGDGGVASATNSTTVISGSFSVGGKGGSAGRGGAVSVTNSGGVTTLGDASHGIFAQSIGGGGGTAGIAQTETAAFSAFGISVGGNGGNDAGGGTVTVGSSGAVTTGGDDAIGILAQSIGGGGGTMLLTTIGSADNGAIGESETGFIPYTTLVPVTISGTNGQSGDAAATAVALSGSAVIATSGLNAYGILAQSIGGGGGLLLGVETKDSAQIDSNDLRDYESAGSQRGAGGSVTVTLTDNAQINSTGDGAAGVVAQSFGGGGAMLGGLSSVDFRLGAGSSLGDTEGTGGDISVTLGGNASITTAGARAHGIVAQALGGGGVVNGGVAAGSGTASCSAQGCTGKVSLDLQGWVTASGTGSYAVVAQSVGNANNEIDISVDAIVRGIGSSAGTMYLETTGLATVNNWGYIGGSIDGLAVTGRGAGTINNNVWLTGNIDAPSYLINNTSASQATFFMGRNVNVAKLLNNGNVVVGLTGSSPSNSTLTGTFESHGGIVVDVDFANQTGDYLSIQGDAAVDGTIYVNPISLQNETVAVLGATSLTAGSLAASGYSFDQEFLDDAVHAKANYLFSYRAEARGTEIHVTPVADFRQADPGLSGNEAEAAGHLQAVWDAGGPSPFAETFVQLSQQVTDDTTYRQTLDAISGEALGNVAVVRPSLNRMFISNMMSCPTFADAGVLLSEESCTWARASGGWLDRRGTGDNAGFDADTKTFQVGGQAEFRDNWFLGASAAYEDLDLRSRGSATRGKGDSVTLGLVLKHATDRWLLAGTLSGGLSRVSNRRTVTIGNFNTTARSTPDSQHVTAHVRAAYHFSGEGWYLKPALDADITYIHADSFAESGSPYALRVSAEDDVSLSASPTIEAGGRFDMGDNGFARPFLRAGAVVHASNDWVGHATLSDAPSGTAPFRSSSRLPTFTGRVGAGLDVVTAQGFEAKVQYDAELSRGFSSQVAAVRLAYRFR